MIEVNQHGIDFHAAGTRREEKGFNFTSGLKSPLYSTPKKMDHKMAKKKCPPSKKKKKKKKRDPNLYFVNKELVSKKSRIKTNKLLCAEWRDSVLCFLRLTRVFNLALT